MKLLFRTINLFPSESMLKGLMYVTIIVTFIFIIILSNGFLCEPVGELIICCDKYPYNVAVVDVNKRKVVMVKYSPQECISIYHNYGIVFVSRYINDELYVFTSPILGEKVINVDLTSLEDIGTTSFDFDFPSKGFYVIKTPTGDVLDYGYTYGSMNIVLPRIPLVIEFYGEDNKYYSTVLIETEVETATYPPKAMVEEFREAGKVPQEIGVKSVEILDIKKVIVFMGISLIISFSLYFMVARKMQVYRH